MRLAESLEKELLRINKLKNLLIRELISWRAVERIDNKNYELSDKIRDILEKYGVTILDGHIGYSKYHSPWEEINE